LTAPQWIVNFEDACTIRATYTAGKGA
jgi:hypothetical protein